MDHKEMCYTWVESMKSEEDDGWWILDQPNSTDLVEGPFRTEREVDDILWSRALDEAHERFIP